MRFQLDVPTSEIGAGPTLSTAQAASLVERIRQRLADAGFSVSVGEDRADVDPELPDWQHLSDAERTAGGYHYPELSVSGPAQLTVAVLRTSVLLSSDPRENSAQEATSQVVVALRALDGVVPVPAAEWARIEEAASALAITADGTITRSVLSSDEVTNRAIALFDVATSPEWERPWTARYADQLDALGALTAGFPPFRAGVAASPSGTAFGLELPSDPPFTFQAMRPLSKAMRAVVKDVLRQEDGRTGLPTGLVLTHDGNATHARVVFDNLVDSGSADPPQRERRYREAPFGWEAIAEAAARRDPEYQPTWLPDAVGLLVAGGASIEVRTSPAAD